MSVPRSRRKSGEAPIDFPSDPPKGINDGLKEKVVSRIRIPSDEEVDSVPSIHPTGIETVASYNWVVDARGQHKRIIVPGYPPFWSPPKGGWDGAVQIEPDCGFRFVDQNNYFSPRAPLLPVLRAVDAQSPDFDFKSVDFITDRNNLIKLFKFVSGYLCNVPSQARWEAVNPDIMQKDKNLRIDMDILGNNGAAAAGGGSSMLMSRWEPTSSDFVRKEEFQGFSFNFLKEYTRYLPDAPELGPDAKSQGHHRVVSYVLGGCRLLVRYQGDGCIESPEELARMWGTASPNIEKGKEVMGSHRNESRDTTGEGAKENSNMSPSSSGSPLGDNGKYIEVRKTPGPIHPLSSIIGVKTITAKKTLDLSRVLPQAFFSQTQLLYTGYHVRGSFKRVQKLGTEPLLRPWEIENERHIKKLIVLLKRIKGVVEKMEGRRASVIFNWGRRENGVNIYRREDGDSGIPGELVARWG